MTLLILNGSLGGATGNTSALIERFCRLIKTCVSPIEIIVRHLAHAPYTSLEDSSSELSRADAVVITTGVYWDSWGSPLQQFFEQITALEGAPCLFGKPVAVVVTMHSVGGKEVLSRLQGVLNSFGLFVPPMAALTYSLVNELALKNETDFADDVWCLDDLETVANNLIEAAHISRSLNWKSWPVDRQDPKRRWLK